MSRFFSRATATTPESEQQHALEIGQLASNCLLFVNSFRLSNPNVVAPARAPVFREMASWAEAQLLFGRIADNHLWTNLHQALVNALSEPDRARVNETSPPSGSMLFAATPNPNSLMVGVRTGRTVADGRIYVKLYMHYV